MSEAAFSPPRPRKAPRRKSSANDFFGYDEHRGSYKAHRRQSSQTVASSRNPSRQALHHQQRPAQMPSGHRRVQSASMDTSPFADFGGEASDDSESEDEQQEERRGEDEPSIYARDGDHHEEGEPSRELNEDSLIRALYRRSPPPETDILSPTTRQTMKKISRRGPPHRTRKETPTPTSRPTTSRPGKSSSSSNNNNNNHNTSTTICGRVKIIFLGVAGVGKTSLIRRFDRQDVVCPRATMSVDFLKMVRRVGDTSLEVYIWDTAGQERFRALSLGYYRSAHGAVLVESIDSFLDAKRLDVFYDNLKKHGPSEHECKCVLLLNKSDLYPEKNAAVFEQVSRWASDKNMPVFLTSAITGDNVDEGIECLLRSIIDDKMLRKHVLLAEKSKKNERTNHDTLTVKNARPGSRMKSGNCRC